jgi:hypothetical protein
MPFDPDTVEIEQKKSAFFGTLFCVLLLQAYVPIAVGLGWASIHSGPLAELPSWGLVPGFVACFVVVHFAIVAPFLHSGSLKNGSSLGRSLFAAALWSVPLFAFAYWVGDFKQALHAVDFSFSLLASLCTALILYRRAQSPWALSLGVAAGVFFPLFVLDDILGPFNPAWVFSTLEPSVYLLRAVGTSVAVLSACFYPIPVLGRVPSGLGERRFALLLLTFVGGFLCLFESSSFNEVPGPLSPDLNWIASLSLIFFLQRKDVFGRRSYVGLSIFYAASLFTQCTALVISSEGTAVDQVKLLYLTLILGVVVTELRVRWRFAFREPSWGYFSRETLSEV